MAAQPRRRAGDGSYRHRPWTIAPRSRCSSVVRPAPSGGSSRDALGSPGGHRAGAVRPGRRAVSDDVLPHLPPPRRRRLEARGRRRRGALERRRRLRSGAARRSRAGDRGADPHPPRAGRGRAGADDGASLVTGIGGSRNPTALKCLHAHVAFALARPGYRLGESCLPSCPSAGPRPAVHAPR